MVAAALGVFTLGCLSFPFLLTSRSSKERPIIDSSKALGPQAVQRGPYINAGSKDIGPDPTPIEAYKSRRLAQEQQHQGEEQTKKGVP